MLHATATPSSFPGVPSAPHEIRALLLDDSNFDRARIRRLSHKTDLCVHMDEVESIAAMDQAVARNNYDIQLVLLYLPVVSYRITKVTYNPTSPNFPSAI